jgi:RNA polymerase sigma-70 factor (ECF subfamily)
MEHEHKTGCKDVFALLSEYLDAELTPDLCAGIEAHLEHCPPCIDFLESLKRSIRLCRDCQPAEPLPPLAPETKERLLTAYRKALAARKDT